MPYGWLSTIKNADEYFNEERLDSSEWFNLSDDKRKQKALVMGYNRLYYHPDYSLPTYAAATAAQLVILRKANCEMSYYFCHELTAEDRRKGIQAQGVVKAGIVKEDYDKDMLEQIPLPPIVIIWLKPWSTVGSVIASQDIGRDEDESTQTEIQTT